MNTDKKLQHLKKMIFFSILMFINIHLPAEETNDFTRITSEGKLILNYKGKIADFYKNVIVKNQSGIMKADFLTIIFDENFENVQKMTASGHVLIDQKSQQAESEKAEYFAKDFKLILTGNPIIKKGQNYYSADKIIIDTKTDKVYFEPSAKIVIKKNSVNGAEKDKQGLL